MAEVPPDNLSANPDGPIVLVGAGSADGSDWTVHAFVSGDQVCISSRFPPFGEGGGCGARPAAGEFGPVDLYPQSESVALFVGIVSNQVASVGFDYGNGQLEDVALVSLERAGIESYGYVMAVPVDRLALSVKTVEGQVATILSKLGPEEHPDDNRRVLAVLAYIDGRNRA